MMAFLKGNSFNKTDREKRENELTFRNLLNFQLHQTPQYEMTLPSPPPRIHSGCTRKQRSAVAASRMGRSRHGGRHGSLDVIGSKIVWLFCICCKKKFTSIMLIMMGLILSCSVPKEVEEPLTVIRQPAEFEPTAAVWLIWPPADHTAETSNSAVTLNIMEALGTDVKVVVTCANDVVCEQARSRIAERFKEQSHITVQPLASVEIWARDMGPTFVETNQGLAVADFQFNSWGYSDTTDADNQTEERYDRSAAALLKLPVIKTKLFSEGGNREVNGQGTLMLSEVVERGRNPAMSLKEMEAEFERTLGVTHVVWLKKGLHEDDHTFLGPIELEDGEPAYTVITTNGHIDEFARFVNDSTVLLAQVDSADFDDPIAYENHLRMQENFNILEKARDQDGQPFHIVRLTLPRTIVATMKPGDGVYDYIKTLNYQDGSTFPEGEAVKVIAAASYLNFLITSNIVLGQKYWREGWDPVLKVRDSLAERTLMRVFPDREVVMLDALAVNLGGGGIHCITMQQPFFGNN